MKIALLTEYFFPEGQGGTELYVFNLAKALIKTGNAVEIISLHDEKKESIYQGITIRYIPFNCRRSKAVISGNAAPDNVAGLLNLIKVNQYQVLNFHTITPSLGFYHFEACADAGFRCFLTSHVPGHTCMRGDLLHMGSEICDGKIDIQKCSACYFHYRGTPLPLNKVLPDVFRAAGLFPTLAHAAGLKQEQLARMGRFLSGLIVVSGWQREVFLRNNFDARKLRICRQAVDAVSSQKNKKIVGTPLRMGFIGRISPEKGLHILLSAIGELNPEDIELHVAAIPVRTEKDYGKKMAHAASEMKNVTWQENIPNTIICDFLTTLDVLCVPSQGLETGPFVVYEALAAGVPVLGSNLGGIAELIEENKNGWLFPFDDIVALKNKIKTLIDKKQMGHWESVTVAPARTPDTMAEEMLNIYNSL